MDKNLGHVGMAYRMDMQMEMHNGPAATTSSLDMQHGDMNMYCSVDIEA
jgi:fructoselysine-6-P-deglycase FrlB-like protein